MESEFESNATDVLVIISTFPDADVARQIGTVLVGSQLIACINIIPNVESIYQWEGKIESGSEVIGLMKTTERQLVKLKSKFESIHPYEVPEFLVLDVSDGLPNYLGWVKNYCN